MEKKYLLKSYWLKVLTFLPLPFIGCIRVLACEACKKQQPKILQGITHGPGPESIWDYVIVTVMILLTLYVLMATIKCAFRPSEENKGHIKRIILNEQR